MKELGEKSAKDIFREKSRKSSREPENNAQYYAASAGYQDHSSQANHLEDPSAAAGSIHPHNQTIKMI